MVAAFTVASPILRRNRIRRASAALEANDALTARTR
jgi:hypothetical protein